MISETKVLSMIIKISDNTREIDLMQQFKDLKRA